MSVHWEGGLHLVKSVHANSSDQLEFASVGLLCVRWGTRKGRFHFFSHWELVKHPTCRHCSAH